MTDRDQVICRVLVDVARGKSRQIDEVRPDHALVEDLGLRSLDLAQIVVKLEIELGVDPFARLVPVTSVRTVGDLCGAYAKCFSPDGDSQADSEDTADPAHTERRRSLRLKTFDAKATRRREEARKGL